MRDPNFLCRHLLEATARRGLDIAPSMARSAVAALLGWSEWARLIREWGTSAGPLHDSQLGNGQVLARRSRQIEVLRGLGLTHGESLVVLYELQPTAEFDMTAVTPEEVLRSSHAVRDGHCVQLKERAGGWAVVVGLGRLQADGELFVQSVRSTVVVGDLREEAARVASAILTGMARDVRDAFVGQRAYYAFPAGSLIETEFGAMDAFELISEELGRAFMSGSVEKGCYLIGSRAARKLPFFATFGRDLSGSLALDAEGLGLIIPLLFKAEFTDAEIEESSRVLLADYPLTHSVLSGLALTPQNFADVVREWDEAYDLGEMPDFIVVQKIKELDGEVVVAAIRATDMLARRPIMNTYLFSMPAEEFERGEVLDPYRHRRVDDNGSLTMVRFDP